MRSRAAKLVWEILNIFLLLKSFLHHSLNENLLLLYSQLSLKWHLCKTGISIRRHLVLVLAVSQSSYYNQTLYKTDNSIRRTTEILKWSTDTYKVLNVTKIMI